MDSYSKTTHAYSAGVPITESISRNVGNEKSAPAEPSQRMEVMPSYASSSRRTAFWTIRYLVILLVIGAPLAVPVIIFRHDRNLSVDDEVSAETRQYRQLVFYLFLWLLVTWIGGMGSYGVASGLPHLFRFTARYINPAHQRYWRIFRMIKLPITLVGLLLASYIAFDVLINSNMLLIVNQSKDPNYMGWDDVIDDVLQQCTIWTALYFVEKVLIAFITIQYHYRSNLVRIERSKEIHRALITLYEASVYLYPLGSPVFAVEDSLIRHASSSSNTSSTKFCLSRTGISTRGITTLFGNTLSDNDSTHWFRPSSSYAVVQRALSQPDSEPAAALARRIWTSLVLSGRPGLTAADISSVLGPYRHEEASSVFKTMDENGNGEIHLDEMIWTVVEAARVRAAIYAGMADADHCINTFDWVALTLLATVMVFFILVLYVPSIKDIQQTAGFIVIGLSFAVGRTFNHFLTGCVFVFFDHPFDVGDRVEVWNLASATSLALVVKRQSLLYTVFRRLDTGANVQIANEKLSQKRIENLTRSGANRQAVSVTVDFATSFRDLTALRQELEAFLRENARDYDPSSLGLSIINVNALDRMELRCAFTHKSNWSNEKLRAARSMKFMCALVAAVRKLSIGKPRMLGHEKEPVFTVKVANEGSESQSTRGLCENAKTTPGGEGMGMFGGGNDKEMSAAAHAEEEAARAVLSKTPVVVSARQEDIGTSTGIYLGVPEGQSSTGLRMKPGTGAHTMMHR